MATLTYAPTKRGINEKGNKAWTYKNTDAIERVLGYILMPQDVSVTASNALGLPLLGIPEMANTFRYAQAVFRKKTGRLIRHEILAFDNIQESFDVNGCNRIDEIACQCAYYYYSMGFQTVYAIWKTDQMKCRNTPEIHFAVNTVSICDGHKYQTNPAKKLLQEGYFNSVLQYFTGKGTGIIRGHDEDEPDYSDYLYYPSLL